MFSNWARAEDTTEPVSAGAVRSPGHNLCHKYFGAAPTQAAFEKELPEICLKKGIYSSQRVPTLMAVVNSRAGQKYLGQIVKN